MARRLWAIAAGIVCLAACGAQPDPDATVSTDTAASAPAGTAPTPQISSDERGVAVRVSGVLSEGTSLCPAQESTCGYALKLDGAIGPVADGDFVVGLGWYDGQRVALAGPLTRGDSPFPPAPTFDSLCPEMTNPPNLDTGQVMETANAILDRKDVGHDALATAWIDQGSNVVTLWFARDLDRYREDLLKAFGEMNVCLVEGARYSELELREASDRVLELMTKGTFVIQGGFGADELRNRVVVPIEAIDPGGRAELDQLDAVIAVPFIELLDRPLPELPAWQPAVEGTVDLMTATSRSVGGMAALGTFTLQYDATGNCLYSDLDGQRYTLVWPFGYSATELNGKITVFDPRGQQVAVTGEPVELGGGNDAGAGGDGLLKVTATGNNCGANAYWIVNNG